MFWFLVLLQAIHVTTYWVVAFVAHDTQHVNDDAKKQVLTNQLLWAPIVTVPLLWAFPPPLDDDSLLLSAFQLVGCVLLMDIFVYCAHRPFHGCLLLQWAHRLHHTWNEPAPYTAFDAHPLEHMLVNTAPALMAAICVRASRSLLCVWVAVVAVSSVLAHRNIGFHSLHHKHRTCNFGTWPLLLDRLCGTYRNK